MKRQMVYIMMVFWVMIVSHFAEAAKLCGVISAQTDWDGGVFSVIRLDGKTIATTSYMSVGAQACTDVFAEGTYIVRFNGVLERNVNSLPKDSDPIYGCITPPFVFSTATFFVVFDQGNPPFNGNSFCFPAKSS